MGYTDILREIRGTLYLRAYDRAGTRLWEISERNLIVAAGYDAICRALAGAGGGHIIRVAVGTNGTAAAESDTQITDAVMLDITSVEYPKTGTVRFKFTIGYEDANDIAVREFGLIMADGGLFSRRVREPLEKTPDMTISGMWDISMT